MSRLSLKWTWLGTIVFFFAWLFVVHGVGLVLHEVGGHGLAERIVGCGIGRFNLTYFGGGSTPATPCAQWTWTMFAIIGWAGIAVTLSAGAVAMAFQRRAGLTPLTRLLLAILATQFLLSELRYATSGGFHEVGDPGLTAATLEIYGLHVFAWLPPLVLYAVAALYGARAIVDAFREHFGSRTRLHTLKQMAATLGAARLLLFVAFRIESAIRTDVPSGEAVPAQWRAIALEMAPLHQFPIQRVLLAIVVAAFVLAFAQPVRPREGVEDAAPGGIPRRHAVGVAVAALVCFVAITVLVRV